MWKLRGSHELDMKHFRWVGETGIAHWEKYRSSVRKDKTSEKTRKKKSRGWYGQSKAILVGTWAYRKASLKDVGLSGADTGVEKRFWNTVEERTHIRSNILERTRNKAQVSHRCKFNGESQQKSTWEASSLPRQTKGSQSDRQSKSFRHRGDGQQQEHRGILLFCQ